MNEIDTGDAAPIRQRCYNHTPHITSEINRQIDEQLGNGQIYGLQEAELSNERNLVSFPTITNFLDTMSVHQPSWFTLIDMRSAYSLVKMHQ